MTERSVIQSETFTENGIARRKTLRSDYGRGVRHRYEEAGGAVAGAIVGRPVGAVVGGAIGAATGATAGAIDQKDRDETSVVTSEVQRP